MSKESIQTFVEIGPGKVLTGMVKRTLKNVKNYSINTSEDIKDLINEFPSLFHQGKKGPCSSKILAEGGLTDFENCGKKMDEMFGLINIKKDGENEKEKNKI